MSSAQLSNWIVALLVVERVFAFYCPMVARRLFDEEFVKKSFIVILIITLLFQIPYLCIRKVRHFEYLQTKRECSSVSSLPVRLFLFGLSYGMTYFVPNIFEIFSISILFLKIKETVKNRAVIKSKKIRYHLRKEISTALTVSFIVLIRFLIYIPLMISAILFLYASSSLPSNSPLEALAGTLTKLFTNITVLTTFCNWCVYCLRYSKFRKFCVRM